MPRLPMFDCDVLDARDVQGETLFVVKNEARFELWAKGGVLIAVASKIRSLTKYAHGERCAAVRIDSAIEDD